MQSLPYLRSQARDMQPYSPSSPKKQDDCPFVPAQPKAGYFGAGAAECPAGSFCPDGASSPVACPSGTASSPGAQFAADCAAAAGYWGTPGRSA